MITRAARGYILKALLFLAILALIAGIVITYLVMFVVSVFNMTSAAYTLGFIYG